MDPERLTRLFETIRKCPHLVSDSPLCRRVNKFEPVINTLRPSQRFLVISSDPSRDTNKALDRSLPHSDFSVRFLALLFSGNDGRDNALITRDHYAQLSEVFDRSFYWAHFAKCYSKGNPNSFCAQQYLPQELELFKPELIIILGNKTTDFLMGPVPLSQRVGRVLDHHGIPTFCSLHPSRDWNLSKRSQYHFDQTWNLIRSNLHFPPEDKKIVESIFGPQIFP